MLAVIIVDIFQCIHISNESIVVSNNNNNLHVNSIGNRIADRQMHIYMNCELQYSPIHNQLENGTTGENFNWIQMIGENVSRLLTINKKSERRIFHLVVQNAKRGDCP